MHVEINESNNANLYAARWDQINKEYAKEHPTTAYKLVEITETTYVPDTYYYDKNGQKVLDTNVTYTEDRTYYEPIKLVNNLADYYANIETIKDLAHGKFLFMPLDEEPIVINTDTRQMSIPKHFTSYGLSVQGDNHAEMIFFKMPRYFDYHDLARDDLDIGINWQIMGIKETIVGSSAAAIIDTTLFPNFVLFGWLITTDMTAYKASIKFAVEVCTKGLLGQTAVEKAFSFNTTPATLNIVEGLLVPGAPVLTIDEQQNVLNTIIKNSEYTEESLPELARPMVVLPMTEYTNMNNADTSTNLVVGFYSETLKGTSTSAKLKYQWVLPTGAFAEGQIDYIKDTSGVFNAQRNYYEFNGVKYIPVIFATKTEYDNFIADKDIFVEVTKLTATTPGHYRCIAMTNDTVNGVDYNGRSNYNNTTILGAFEPHINWIPGEDLLAYGDKYVEYDNNSKTYTLYADQNNYDASVTNAKTQAITLAATPDILTKDKEFMDVTGEPKIIKKLTDAGTQEYLGKLTYGVLNTAETNFDETAAVLVDKIGVADTATLTLLNITDGAEVKCGVKHFKNNDLATKDNIYKNTETNFITYYYPSSVEDLKFTIGTADGSLTSAIFTLSDANSALGLSLNTAKVNEVDAYEYNTTWSGPAHGTYHYIWEYKKGSNAYAPFVKFGLPPEDDSGKTIIVTRESFADNFKVGDVYKIRLRIECHNGNRIYQNKDNTYGVYSQNELQVVGIA